MIVTVDLILRPLLLIALSILAFRQTGKELELFQNQRELDAFDPVESFLPDLQWWTRAPWSSHNLRPKEDDLEGSSGDGLLADQSQQHQNQLDTSRHDVSLKSNVSNVPLKARDAYFHQFMNDFKWLQVDLMDRFNHRCLQRDKSDSSASSSHHSFSDLPLEVTRNHFFSYSNLPAFVSYRPKLAMLKNVAFSWLATSAIATSVVFIFRIWSVLFPPTATAGGGRSKAGHFSRKWSTRLISFLLLAPLLTLEAINLVGAAIHFPFILEELKQRGAFGPIEDDNNPNSSNYNQSLEIVKFAAQFAWHAPLFGLSRAIKLMQSELILGSCFCVTLATWTWSYLQLITTRTFIPKRRSHVVPWMFSALTVLYVPALGFVYSNFLVAPSSSSNSNNNTNNSSGNSGGPTSPIGSRKSILKNAVTREDSFHIHPGNSAASIFNLVSAVNSSPSSVVNSPTPKSNGPLRSFKANNEKSDLSVNTGYPSTFSVYGQAANIIDDEEEQWIENSEKNNNSSSLNSALEPLLLEKKGKGIERSEEALNPADLLERIEQLQIALNYERKSSNIQNEQISDLKGRISRLSQEEADNEKIDALNLKIETLLREKENWKEKANELQEALERFTIAASVPVTPLTTEPANNGRRSPESVTFKSFPPSPSLRSRVQRLDTEFSASDLTNQPQSGEYSNMSSAVSKDSLINDPQIAEFMVQLKEEMMSVLQAREDQQQQKAKNTSSSSDASETLPVTRDSLIHELLQLTQTQDPSIVCSSFLVLFREQEDTISKLKKQVSSLEDHCQELEVDLIKKNQELSKLTNKLRQMKKETSALKAEFKKILDDFQQMGYNSNISGYD